MVQKSGYKAAFLVFVYTRNSFTNSVLRGHLPAATVEISSTSAASVSTSAASAAESAIFARNHRFGFVDDDCPSVERFAV